MMDSKIMDGLEQFCPRDESYVPLTSKHVDYRRGVKFLGTPPPLSWLERCNELGRVASLIGSRLWMLRGMLDGESLPLDYGDFSERFGVETAEIIDALNAMKNQNLIEFGEMANRVVEVNILLKTSWLK